MCFSVGLQDNCPRVYNPDQKDVDRDGIGDACDPCNLTGPNGIVDRDRDGVDDICDNCPQFANPKQENGDNDATGDACDPDNDNDGISKAIYSHNACIIM